MKLSNSKKFGYTQVHGSRFLRVAKTHAVDIGGLSVTGHQPPDYRTGEVPSTDPLENKSVVFAQPGDLVVEMVDVPKGVRKTPRVIGWSYLSGPALRLNGYTDAVDVGYFKAATSGVVVLPDIEGFTDQRAFMGACVAAFADARYSGLYDVLAFRYNVKGSPGVEKDAGLALIEWCNYCPKGLSEADESKLRTHMFGIVRRRKNKKKIDPKSGVYFHVQPPCDSSDWSATGFQMELAVRTVFRLESK